MSHNVTKTFCISIAPVKKNTKRPLQTLISLQCQGGIKSVEIGKASNTVDNSVQVKPAAKVQMECMCDTFTHPSSAPTPSLSEAGCCLLQRHGD